MKIKVEELLDPEKYLRLLSIKHDEIIFFIRENIRPVNFSMIFFYGFNGFLLLFLGIDLIRDIQLDQSLWRMAAFFIAGLAAFFVLLIPLHEGIHWFAFKTLGARWVKITAQWDKFLFYATADQFVMNYREFLYLALLPFLIINSVCIVLLCVSDSIWGYAVWAALILHSTGCIGDFCLIGFLGKKENRDVLSYDDFKTKETYFFKPLDSGMNKDSRLSIS